MTALLAYVPWNVSPIIAEIGPLLLRWYGVLFALGFVIGSFVLTHIYKSEGVRPYWVDVITFYMVVGTVLGARLGHVFFYDWDQYKDQPWEILKIWHGGLASHGATIGILLALFIFSMRNKFDYLWVLDRIVIVVAIGGACIRLGNLMNSEIVGKPTTEPWGFVFPRDIEHLQQFRPDQPVPAGAVAVQRTRVEGKEEPEFTVTPVSGVVSPSAEVAVPRHPTQIYESLFCLFLVALLYGLWNKYKENTPRGLLFGLFVVLLFSFRIFVEYFKENQVTKETGIIAEYGLNIGQLLSIPFILIGLWVLLRAGKNPKNPHGFAPRDLAEEEAAQAAAAKA
ncbi:prolipoprotein diacylglyceryl transferase [Hymenobacter sp. BT559]|jgi:prolipoprotein diacylglyceryl transferase|uniref:prolipoprotein diacylglyceryl transferase n=1 Tax=Hymenobacter sp. BT559 TaxID=2795729 RepID=UPI0018ECEB59|nr:prolipoprotein diacylglyceryl transferase [Hymenobacter sp. BT559]MBJ6143849.1 prolipoprotein diacylglyceryl transferase [Hymenobacter sp. BT559]